jgi:recombinase-like zinc beta ribbon protein
VELDAFELPVEAEAAASCGSCGGTMQKRARARDHSVYECRHRHHRCNTPARIDASLLEQLVVRRFFAWLARLDRAAARARLAEREARTIEADSEYGRALAAARTQEHASEARQASEQAWLGLASEARLALVLELPPAADLRRRWPSLSVTERRHVLAAALATVTVRATAGPPGRGSGVRIDFVGGRGAGARQSVCASQPPN